MKWHILEGSFFIECGNEANADELYDAFVNQAAEWHEFNTKDEALDYYNKAKLFKAYRCYKTIWHIDGIALYYEAEDGTATVEGFKID